MIPIVSRLTRLILFLGGFALLASLGSLISGADDGDPDDGALDAETVPSIWEDTTASFRTKP